MAEAVIPEVDLEKKIYNIKIRKDIFHKIILSQPNKILIQIKKRKRD